MSKRDEMALKYAKGWQTSNTAEVAFKAGWDACESLYFEVNRDHLKTIQEYQRVIDLLQKDLKRETK